MELGQENRPESSSVPDGQTSRPRQLNKSRLQQLADENYVPPDGGWGWMCVLACFVTYFLIVGMSRSFGVIYSDVQRAFPGTKNIVLVMLPSMVITLTVGLAIVSGALTIATSCRTVAFIGGLLSGVGLSLNFFAMNLYYMLFCYIIAGIGAGLATNPGIIIVAKYFRKRRSQALGFSLAGTAIGSMIQPILLKYLSTTFGFRGALLIQGAMMLHVCAGALLYRDPTLIRPISQTTSIQVDSSQLAMHNENIIEEKSTNAWFRWIERHLYVDLTLLYNPIFVLLCISAMCLSVGYPQTLVLIPPHAEELGFSLYLGSYLLSISSFGDLLGRLATGFIFDRKIITKDAGFVIAAVMLSTALICIAFSEYYIELAIGVFFYGTFAGSSFVLLPILLTKNHGVSRLASSFGILRSSMALTCLIGPLVAGYIRDVTGSFKASIWTIGIIAFFATVFVLIIILLKYRSKTQFQNQITG